MQDCQIQILRIVKKEWLSLANFFLYYVMFFIHQWFKRQEMQIHIYKAEEILHMIFNEHHR